MFNLGTTATPAPNDDPAREPLDTLNGFLTFSVVFYRYSGNDEADEE
jgi:hypothetical protein